MSMSKCKCGKIFDTDFELGVDKQGNCACDNCCEQIVTEQIEYHNKRRTAEFNEENK